MKIAIVNQSKADAAAFPRLAEGVKKFLDQFCADWEVTPIDVQYFADASAVPAGCISCLVLDKPDGENVGYHERDDKGNPLIKGFLDAIPNGELFHGPNGDGGSLIGLLQHEAAETAVDRFANCYVDRSVIDKSTAKEYRAVALEVADPVQEIADTIKLTDGTIVDRIDYVLPVWFSPEAADGTMDRMGALTQAGTLAPGGYAIVRETIAEDGQVCARTLRIDHHLQKMAAWRERLKAHQSSRTMRRLRQRI